MVGWERGRRAGGAALARGDTLILAFSRKGRRDPLVGICTWFRVAGLFANLWIPAFAGMTGGEGEKGSADCARRSVSDDWTVRRCVDSRFRGNDGGRIREGDLSLAIRAWFRVFLRIRICGIIGFFRILPARLPNAGFRGYGESRRVGLPRGRGFSANLKISPKFGRKRLVLYADT